MIITNTLLNPVNGKLGIALPPVFLIFYFMLQNQQNIRKMLKNLPKFLMHVGVLWAICFVCTILFAFGILYTWISDANPGTQMGIGLGGCIGVIGFAFGPLGGVAGTAIGGLLGGFIVGGIYEERLLPVLRGS